MVTQDTPPIIVAVVSQHAGELATLWSTRRVLVRAGGYISLAELASFDERMAAHLDGCVVAEGAGLEILREQFSDLGQANAFALAVVALELRDRAAFEHVLTVGDTTPDCSAGLVSALGWVSSTRLAGVAQGLLKSDLAIRRRLGLAACRMHAVDPGGVLSDALCDKRSEVVIEALRVAAALGKLDALPIAQRDLGCEDDDVVAAAASAAVLLGDRASAVDRLLSLAQGNHHRRDLLELGVRASDVSSTRMLLSQMSEDPSAIRSLIAGTGVAGDSHYVPWLIRQMADSKLARLAGESFTMVTGTDLARSRMGRSQPGGSESGPNDDPDDPNVEMDEDEGLPWPDPDKVAAWWMVNGSTFQSGIRYFMGKPLCREHCLNVLKIGYQRQRIAAAQHLCLLEPGTPLFNTSAPAWRQQRMLATMT